MIAQPALPSQGRSAEEAWYLFSSPNSIKAHSAGYLTLPATPEWLSIFNSWGALQYLADGIISTGTSSHNDH
jgi:hypothetical protein